MKVSLKNIYRLQKYKALNSKIVKNVQFHRENGTKKSFSTSTLCISKTGQYFGMKLSGGLPHCGSLKMKLVWLDVATI